MSFHIASSITFIFSSLKIYHFETVNINIIILDYISFFVKFTENVQSQLFKF